MNRRDALRAMGATTLGLATVATGATSMLPAKTMLPPGLSKKNFQNATSAMRKIVGNEWVFVDETGLLPYNKKYVPDPDEKRAPAGAVCPASAEEVQALIKLANQYKLPLWPVSTGKNMGYGMATPATDGQMILDLKRMNKIISVDPELCTALVEPGVTYQQLADYIEEHNLPLWIDVPTVGPIVGPVGNTLDRGVGYTPYGDHFMFQCGMEVVLPDGDILRTGMGSVKNAEENGIWQAFKWGYGPYIDGIFTQSNFGVVTKMGIWLMPKPPAYKPLVVRHKKVEDVHDLVEAMRPLRISNVIPNVVLMMSGAYQLAMFQRRDEIWSGTESMPDSAMLKAAEKVGLGAWNTYFALYGTEESIAIQEKIIRATFEKTGGEVLTENEMRDNPYFNHHATLMRGGLSLEEVGLVRWRGAGGGLAWFAPVASARGNETTGQIELAKEILAKYGFDYTAAFAIGWRELHHILALLYDRSNPQEHEKAEKCYAELVQRFGEKGWAAYRTGTNSMDLVADQYGSKNREFNKLLKNAIDPNNILAPGKSGIL